MPISNKLLYLSQFRWTNTSLDGNHELVWFLFRLYSEAACVAWFV